MFSRSNRYFSIGVATVGTSAYWRLNTKATLCDHGISSSQTIKSLTLSTATAIADEVIKIAKKNQFNPITVTVVDSHGNTIVVQRMDGCSPSLFPKFSNAKAFTAAGFSIPSRSFRDKYTKPGTSTPEFGQMLSMVDISEGKLAPFPGGVVIRERKEDGTVGPVIGAVGVSGASGDEDEYCAIEAIRTVGLGLVSDPLEHSCKTVKVNG